jgi:transcriptional regulator with XRE-family HTH domain
MSTKKFIIDVDKAIEVHNEKNPETKIDRYALAEKLGLSYQSLTNYQGGRIPEIIGKLKSIIEITDVDFADLVKEKEVK